MTHQTSEPFWDSEPERIGYNPVSPMTDGEVFWWPAAIRNQWTYDNQGLFLQAADYFIEQSIRASKVHAISHRNFNVGCMMFAVDEASFRTGTFYGANFKPTPDSNKQCAEQTALLKATDRGFTHIAGIVIAGPGHTGEPTEPQTELLYPCVDCRELLRVQPLVCEDTVFITVNDDATKKDTLTVGELLTKFS